MILSMPRCHDLAAHTLAAIFLSQARLRVQQSGATYAGGVYPPEAWALFCRPGAAVGRCALSGRTQIVGHVPGGQHVAWMTGAALVKTALCPRAGKIASKDSVILLLCRSGKRSAAAAEAPPWPVYRGVQRAGRRYRRPGHQQRRGDSGGCAYWGLPWVQD